MQKLGIIGLAVGDLGSGPVIPQTQQASNSAQLQTVGISQKYDEYMSIKTHEEMWDK